MAKTKEVTIIPNMNIKKTANIIKVNVGYEGINEGNSIQTPFIAEYIPDKDENGQEKPITAIEYVWNQTVGNERVLRGILVSGHGEYGVPTLREGEVFSALQNIFIAKKTKNGILELKRENVTEEDLCITYTIHELAKELGYKGNISNNIRDSLKRSVEILVATTIFNRYNGGLYDVRTKRYISNPQVAYHYLETMEGYEVVDSKDGSVIDVTKIKLSRFFYESLSNNYKLFYNKENLNKTRNLKARKLYKMALQWSGNKNFSWAMIDTLLEKLPMRQKLEKHKRQEVKKVLDILNNKGMCKVVYDKYNEEKVYFIFKDDVKIEDDINLHSKYNSFTEITEGLRKIGFLEIQISMIWDKYIQDIKYISALLRYCDVKFRYEKITNPTNYFEEYLKNKYPIDEKYYTEGQ